MVKRVPSGDGNPPDDLARASLRVVARRGEPRPAQGDEAADQVQVLRDDKGSYLMTESGAVPIPERDAPVPPPVGAGLGVTVVHRAPDPSRRLRLEPHGLVILTVAPHSRAARAGLRPGDVLERVNRVPLLDVAVLRQAVQGMADQPLLLQVVRHETRFYITANVW